MKEWSIRLANPKDIPFIYDVWLQCYRHGSALGKSCRSRVFFENYRIVVDSILKNPFTKVRVACLPNDPNVILGYLVHTDKTLHWMFVKEVFRGMGIALSLYEEAFSKEDSVTCSHKTFAVEEAFHLFKQLEFNPFVLYQKEMS